jgi:hypothetical protein
LGLKRNEVTGGWTKLHSEGTAELMLFIKYNYDDQVKKNEIGRKCSMKCGRRGLHIGYWWEARKKPLGRPRYRCLDNTKMDFGEMACGGVD